MFLHPLRNIPSSAASEIDHDIALGLRAADQHISLGRRLDRVGSIANDTGDECETVSTSGLLDNRDVVELFGNTVKVP